MPRLAALLVALVSAVLLAGCSDQAGDSSPAPETSPSAPAAGSGSADAPAEDEPSTPPPARADVTMNDAGNIGGPFDKSWAVDVPEAGYLGVLVQMNLTPAQDGAPVTARVFVSFAGPDGATLKSATLGLGGSAAVEFAFGPGELEPGAYTLTATAEPQPGGLPGSPSFGVAKYAVSGITDY